MRYGLSCNRPLPHATNKSRDFPGSIHLTDKAAVSSDTAAFIGRRGLPIFYRYGIYLDLYAHRQFGHLITYAGRHIFCIIPSIYPVHRGEVVHVIQKHGRFHDILERISGLLQNGGGIVERLCGLLLDGFRYLAVGRIYRKLSRNVKGAAGLDSLRIGPYRFGSIGRCDYFFMTYWLLMNSIRTKQCKYTDIR